MTLLGDAAHPMYPIGSNGASQAILDADALAKAFVSQPTAEDALRAYEEMRLAPTAAIVASNRKNGPERVMQVVEERAPGGFKNLYDVISLKTTVLILSIKKYSLVCRKLASWMSLW